jgi:hypothetical protein
MRVASWESFLKRNLLDIPGSNASENSEVAKSGQSGKSS